MDLRVREVRNQGVLRASYFKLPYILNGYKADEGFLPPRNRRLPPSHPRKRECASMPGEGRWRLPFQPIRRTHEKVLDGLRENRYEVAGGSSPLTDREKIFLTHLSSCAG